MLLAAVDCLGRATVVVCFADAGVLICESLVIVAHRRVLFEGFDRDSTNPPFAPFVPKSSNNA
eukprot:6479828-Amphidinium_carterae.1